VEQAMRIYGTRPIQELDPAIRRNDTITGHVAALRAREISDPRLIGARVADDLLKKASRTLVTQDRWEETCQYDYFLGTDNLSLGFTPFVNTTFEIFVLHRPESQFALGIRPKVMSSLKRQKEEDFARHLGKEQGLIQSYFEIEIGRKNNERFSFDCNEIAEKLNNILENRLVTGIHIATGLQERGRSFKLGLSDGLMISFYLYHIDSYSPIRRRGARIAGSVLSVPQFPEGMELFDYARLSDEDRQKIPDKFLNPSIAVKIEHVSQVPIFDPMIRERVATLIEGNGDRKGLFTLFSESD
jgi:hypothetical protein